MAYPTGMLSLTLEDVDREMVKLKGYATRQKDRLNTNPITATVVLDIYAKLNAVKSLFEAAASVPGIVGYARDQKDDQTLNLVTEFNVVVAAIDAVIAQIATDIPTANQGGTDYLLVQTLGALIPEWRDFTPVQLATTRGLLQAIIDAIN